MRRLRRWLKVPQPKAKTTVESEKNNNIFEVTSSEDENPTDSNEATKDVQSLVNSIKAKYVKRDITTKAQTSYTSGYMENKFIATRILGHFE